MVPFGTTCSMAVPDPRPLPPQHPSDIFSASRTPGASGTMPRYSDHAARGEPGPVGDLVAAFKHHKAGRLERAEALYRKVLQKMPSNPDALHLLGVIALDRGHLDQAIQLISKALAVHPK